MGYIDLYSSSNFQEFTPHIEVYSKPLGRTEFKLVQFRERLKSARILLKRGKPGKLELSFFFETPYAYPSQSHSGGTFTITSVGSGQQQQVATGATDYDVNQDEQGVITRPSIEELLGVVPLDARVRLSLGYSDAFKFFGPFYIINQEIIFEDGGFLVNCEAQTFGIPSHASAFKVYSEGSYFSLIENVLNRSGFRADSASFQRAIDDSLVQVYLDAKDELNELNVLIEAQGGSRQADQALARRRDRLAMAIDNAEFGATEIGPYGRGISHEDIKARRFYRPAAMGTGTIDPDHPFVQLGESDYFLMLKVCDSLGVDFFVDPENPNPVVKFQSVIEAPLSTSRRDIARFIMNFSGNEGERSNVKSIVFKTRKARPGAVRRRLFPPKITNAVPPVRPANENDQSGALVAEQNQATADTPPAEAVSSGREDQRPTMETISKTTQYGRRRNRAQMEYALRKAQEEYDQRQSAREAAAAHEAEQQQQSGGEEVAAESNQEESTDTQAAAETQRDSPAAVIRQRIAKARRASGLTGAELELIAGTPHVFPGQLAELKTHSSVYSRDDMIVDEVEHDISAEGGFNTRVKLKIRPRPRPRTPPAGQPQGSETSSETPSTPTSPATTPTPDPDTPVGSTATVEPPASPQEVVLASNSFRRSGATRGFY